MGAAHIFKPLRTKRMLALHLSRFLPGTPPSETLQKINAFVHEEYYDRIVYCIYWFMVLLFGIPIVGMALPFIMFYELLFCWLVKDRFIEPGNDKEESVISSPTTAKTTTTTTMKKYVVVITGCDSGIGKELALRLAGEGFVVFAGCLQKESFNDLSGVGISTSIYPYLVDVTKDEPVNAFAEAVLEWMKGGGGEGNNNKKEEIRVLHSLINNAGVGILGYCDWLDLKDYEKCMDGKLFLSSKSWKLFTPTHVLFDLLFFRGAHLSLAGLSTVNYFGVIRMTKAFLPILKKQSISGVYTYSQIMNVVSVAGLNSATGFAASTYEGSKYAVEAFTNALRLELRMFGIRVVALNPSFFDTPLSNNVKGRVVQWKEKPSTQEEYGNGKSSDRRP